MEDKFADIYKKNRDSFQKLKMVEQLENIDNLSNDNLKLLDYLSNDEDYEVKAKVAEVLVESNNTEAEKILIKLLKDKDELVRVNACDSLCNSNSYEVICLLKDRILKDKSNLVKGYAILSLADIFVRLNNDIEENRNFFRNLLKIEKVQWVRINIYKALYMIGENMYLDILIKELNNRYYRNRCAVVNILSELISNENNKRIEKALTERLKIENSIAVKSSIENIISHK